jgi:hypothetical protein
MQEIIGMFTCIGYGKIFILNIRFSRFSKPGSEKYPVFKTGSKKYPVFKWFSKPGEIMS